MDFTDFKKVIATGVLVTFLSTSITPPSWAQSISELPQSIESPINVQNLAINSQFASLDERFQAPKSADNRVIIAIQDAHGIFDAQENIRSLIQELEDQYGFELVGLEGGAGKSDHSVYRKFQDPEVLPQVVHEFMKRAELSGGEAAAILNPKPGIFYGIENRDLYFKNRDSFLKAIALKESNLHILTMLERKLDKIRDDIYPPGLLQFHRAEQKFHKGYIPLWEYLNIVLENIEQPSPQALSLHEGEGKRVRVQVNLSEKYPNVFILFEAIARARKRPETKKELEDKEKEITSKIEGRVLFEELKQLSHEIKSAYFSGTSWARNAADPKDIAALDDLYEKLEILENLAALEITRTQFNEYSTHQPDFDLSRFNDFLEKYHVGLSSRTRDERSESVIRDPGSLPTTLDSGFRRNDKEVFDLRPALVFYQDAIKRDDALYQNLVQAMKKENRKHAILVAGGFHTDGLKERMKKDGISYVVYTPRIETIQKENPYLDVMEGKVSYKKGNHFSIQAMLVTMGLADPATVKEFETAFFRLAERLISQTPGKKIDTSRAASILNALEAAYVSSMTPEVQAKVHRFIDLVREELSKKKSLTADDLDTILKKARGEEIPAVTPTAVPRAASLGKGEFLPSQTPRNFIPEEILEIILGDAASDASPRVRFERSGKNLNVLFNVFGNEFRRETLTPGKKLVIGNDSKRSDVTIENDSLAPRHLEIGYDAGGERINVTNHAEGSQAVFLGYRPAHQIIEESASKLAAFIREMNLGFAERYDLEEVLAEGDELQLEVYKALPEIIKQEIVRRANEILARPSPAKALPMPVPVAPPPEKALAPDLRKWVRLKTPKPDFPGRSGIVPTWKAIPLLPEIIQAGIEKRLIQKVEDPNSKYPFEFTSAFKEGEGTYEDERQLLDAVGPVTLSKESSLQYLSDKEWQKSFYQLETGLQEIHVPGKLPAEADVDRERTIEEISAQLNQMKLPKREGGYISFEQAQEDIRAGRYQIILFEAIPYLTLVKGASLGAIDQVIDAYNENYVKDLLGDRDTETLKQRINLLKSVPDLENRIQDALIKEEGFVVFVANVIETALGIKPVSWVSRSLEGFVGQLNEVLPQDQRMIIKPDPRDPNEMFVVNPHPLEVFDTRNIHFDSDLRIGELIIPASEIQAYFNGRNLEEAVTSLGDFRKNVLSDQVKLHFIHGILFGYGYESSREYVQSRFLPKRRDDDLKRIADVFGKENALSMIWDPSGMTDPDTLSHFLRLKDQLDKGLDLEFLIGANLIGYGPSFENDQLDVHTKKMAAVVLFSLALLTPNELKNIFMVPIDSEKNLFNLVSESHFMDYLYNLEQAGKSKYDFAKRLLDYFGITLSPEEQARLKNSSIEQLQNAIQAHFAARFEDVNLKIADGKFTLRVRDLTAQVLPGRPAGASLGALPTAEEMLEVNPKRWIGEGIWQEVTRLNRSKEPQIIHLAANVEEPFLRESVQSLEQKLKEIPRNEFVFVVLHSQSADRLDHIVVMDRARRLVGRAKDLFQGDFMLGDYEYQAYFSVYPRASKSPSPMIYFHNISIGRKKTSLLRGKGLAGEAMKSMVSIFEEKYPGVEIAGNAQHYVAARWFLEYFNARIAFGKSLKKFQDYIFTDGIDEDSSLRQFLRPGRRSDLNYFLSSLEKEARAAKKSPVEIYADTQIPLMGRVRGTPAMPVARSLGLAAIPFTVDFSKIGGGQEQEILAALFSDRKFMGRTIRNIDPSIYPDINPDTQDFPIQSAAPENLHAKSNKIIFKVPVVFQNGQERAFLFIAASGDSFANQPDDSIARTYENIIRPSENPDYNLTHRFGAETERPVQVKNQLASYHVFSLDYLPGVTLDTVVGALEGIVGIPGYPIPERGENRLNKVSLDKLEKALSNLVNIGVLTAEDKSKILDAREKYDETKDPSVLRDAKRQLKNLIYKLDEGAIEAHFRFYQKTGYIQSDPRRNNVIFQVGKDGKWTFKLIDYDSMQRATSPRLAIMSFDIFENKVQPGLIGYSVRPWVWTFDSDKSGFFDAIIHTYGMTNGWRYLSDARNELQAEVDKYHFETDRQILGYIDDYKSRTIESFLRLIKMPTATGPSGASLGAIPASELEALLGNVNFKPEQLIDLLKNDRELAALYPMDAGVREKYTLGQHTVMMMRQFEKYFGAGPEPAGAQRKFFRLFLALHDIGKPKAVQAGDKSKQHEFTRPIMERILKETGSNPRQIRLALALVDGDPLGPYLRGRTGLKSTAAKIREMASKSGLTLEKFFDLLTIFYQTDASSYTEDAGGKPALEYLFEYSKTSKRFRFEPVKRRLVFAPDITQKFDALELEIQRMVREENPAAILAAVRDLIRQGKIEKAIALFNSHPVAFFDQAGLPETLSAFIDYVVETEEVGLDSGIKEKIAQIDLSIVEHMVRKIQEREGEGPVDYRKAQSIIPVKDFNLQEAGETLNEKTLAVLFFKQLDALDFKFRSSRDNKLKRELGFTIAHMVGESIIRKIRRGEIDDALVLYYQFKPADFYEAALLGSMADELSVGLRNIKDREQLANAVTAYLKMKEELWRRGGQRDVVEELRFLRMRDEILIPEEERVPPREVPAALEALTQKIEEGRSVKGEFKELLWTHNTRIETFFEILKSGRIEPRGSRGVNFRYGLDSEYGAVKIVMQKGLGQRFKGKGKDKSEDTEKTFYDFFDKATFYYHRDMPEKELKRRIGRDYDFREYLSALPRGRDDHIRAQQAHFERSFLNPQLQIGVNVDLLEHVEAVLIPEHLYDRVMKFAKEKKIDPELVKRFVKVSGTGKNDNEYYAWKKADGSQPEIGNIDEAIRLGVKRPYWAGNMGPPKASTSATSPKAFAREEAEYLKVLARAVYGVAPAPEPAPQHAMFFELPVRPEIKKEQRPAVVFYPAKAPAQFHPAEVPEEAIAVAPAIPAPATPVPPEAVALSPQELERGRLYRIPIEDISVIYFGSPAEEQKATWPQMRFDSAVIPVKVLVQFDDVKIEKVLRDQLIVIGRKYIDENSIEISKPELSRKHAEIILDTDGRHILIRDPSSKNGTFVFTKSGVGVSTYASSLGQTVTARISDLVSQIRKIQMDVVRFRELTQGLPWDSGQLEALRVGVAPSRILPKFKFDERGQMSIDQFGQKIQGPRRNVSSGVIQEWWMKNHDLSNLRTQEDVEGVLSNGSSYLANRDRIYFAGKGVVGDFTWYKVHQILHDIFLFGLTPDEQKEFEALVRAKQTELAQRNKQESGFFVLGGKETRFPFALNLALSEDSSQKAKTLTDLSEMFARLGGPYLGFPYDKDLSSKIKSDFSYPFFDKIKLRAQEKDLITLRDRLQAASLGLAGGEETYALRPEADWLNPEAWKEFFLKVPAKEKLAGELLLRGVSIPPEIEANKVLPGILEKIRIYDSEKGPGIQGFHFDILAALFSRDPQSNEIRLFQVLKQKGISPADIDEIRMGPLPRFEAADIGRGKGAARDVDLVMIHHVKGATNFAAAVDRNRTQLGQPGVSREVPLRESRTYVESETVKEARKKTDLVPEPYLFVDLKTPRNAQPIRVLFKEFIRGKDLEDWFKDEQKKKVDPRRLNQVMYLIGRMFGQFFQIMGGWPHDMHFGNIIIREISKEKFAPLRMADYTGFSEDPHQYAGYFLDTLGQAEVSLEDLGLNGSEIARQLHYLMNGFESTFKDKQEVEDFFRSVIPLAAKEEGGFDVGMPDESYQSRAISNYFKARPKLKINPIWNEQVGPSARSLGMRSMAVNGSETYLREEISRLFLGDPGNESIPQIRFERTVDDKGSSRMEAVFEIFGAEFRRTPLGPSLAMTVGADENQSDIAIENEKLAPVHLKLELDSTGRRMTIANQSGKAGGTRIGFTRVHEVIEKRARDAASLVKDASLDREDIPGIVEYDFTPEGVEELQKIVPEELLRAFKDEIVQRTNVILDQAGFPPSSEEAASLGRLPSLEEMAKVDPKRWIGGDLLREIESRFNKGKELQIVSMQGELGDLFRRVRELARIPGDEYIVFAVNADMEGHNEHIVAIDRAGKIKQNFADILIGAVKLGALEYHLDFAFFPQYEDMNGKPLVIFNDISIGRSPNSPLRGHGTKTMESIAAVLEDKYPGLPIGSYALNPIILHWFDKYFNGRIALKAGDPRFSSDPTLQLGDIRQLIDPKDPLNIRNFLNALNEKAKTAGDTPDLYFYTKLGAGTIGRGLPVIGQIEPARSAEEDRVIRSLSEEDFRSGAYQIFVEAKDQDGAIQKMTDAYQQLLIPARRQIRRGAENPDELRTQIKEEEQAALRGETQDLNLLLNKLVLGLIEAQPGISPERAASLGVEKLAGAEPEPLALMPEGYWKNPRYRALFFEKKKSADELRSEIAVRGLELAPEAEPLLAKIRFHQPGEKSELKRALVDISSVLFSRDPATGKTRLFQILEAKGISPEQVTGIQIQTLNLVDIGRGKGKNREVAHVIIQHDGREIEMIAAVDKPRPLQTLPSRTEYVSLRAARPKTGLVPEPYLYVEAGLPAGASVAGPVQAPIRVIFKEYLEGIDLDDWFNLLAERPVKANLKMLPDVLYRLGRMFGEIYHQTQGWPLDMHFGNIIISAPDGKFRFRMTDYTGTTRDPELIAFYFNFLLNDDARKALESLHVPPDEVKTYTNYLLRGLESTFASRADFDAFIKSITPGIEEKGDLYSILLLDRYGLTRDSLELDRTWDQTPVTAPGLGAEGRSLGDAEIRVLELRLRDGDRTALVPLFAAQARKGILRDLPSWELNDDKIVVDIAREFLTKFWSRRNTMDPTERQKAQRWYEAINRRRAMWYGDKIILGPVILPTGMRRVLELNEDGTWAVGLDPSGRKLLADLRGETPRMIPVEGVSQIRALSGDGRWASGENWNEEVVLIDLRGDMPRVIPVAGMVLIRALSGDGRWAGGVGRHDGALVDLSGGTPRVIPVAGMNTITTLSGDGRWAGGVDQHGQGALVDLRGETPRVIPVTGMGLIIALSADGRWAGGYDLNVQGAGALVDLRRETPRVIPVAGMALIRALSGDGRWAGGLDHQHGQGVLVDLSGSEPRRIQSENARDILKFFPEPGKLIVRDLQGQARLAYFELNADHRSPEYEGLVVLPPGETLVPQKPAAAQVPTSIWGRLKGAISSWRRGQGPPAAKSLGVGAEKGLCVAGDTMLPVIRDGSLGRTALIPITDVRPGDQVLSLNEATSEIEPHRIKGLLDMGVKPVFKLTTASGRSIKTTANHPYLVEPPRNDSVSQWLKVSELRAGTKIAVPSVDVFYDRVYRDTIKSRQSPKLRIEKLSSPSSKIPFLWQQNQAYSETERKAKRNYKAKPERKCTEKITCQSNGENSLCQIGNKARNKFFSMISQFHSEKQNIIVFNNNQQKYNYSENLSVPGFLKTAYAADSENDILWDTIVAIEYVGREHVYDIEVDGTHNFIGNGIFAHNTYTQAAVPLQLPVTAASLGLAGKGEEEISKIETPVEAKGLIQKEIGYEKLPFSLFETQLRAERWLSPMERREIDRDWRKNRNPDTLRQMAQQIMSGERVASAQDSVEILREAIFLPGVALEEKRELATYFIASLRPNMTKDQTDSLIELLVMATNRRQAAELLEEHAREISPFLGQIMPTFYRPVTEVNRSRVKAAAFTRFVSDMMTSSLPNPDTYWSTSTWKEILFGLWLLAGPFSIVPMYTVGFAWLPILFFTLKSAFVKSKENKLQLLATRRAPVFSDQTFRSVVLQTSWNDDEFFTKRAKRNWFVQNFLTVQSSVTKDWILNELTSNFVQHPQSVTSKQVRAFDATLETLAKRDPAFKEAIGGHRRQLRITFPDFGLKKLKESSPAIPVVLQKENLPAPAVTPLVPAESELASPEIEKKIGGQKRVGEARSLGAAPVELSAQELAYFEEENEDFRRKDGGRVLLERFSGEYNLMSRFQGTYAPEIERYKKKLDLGIAGQDVLAVPGYGVNGFLLAEYGNPRSVTVVDKDPVSIAWLKAIKKYWNFRESPNTASVGEIFISALDADLSLEKAGKIPQDKDYSRTSYNLWYMIGLIQQGIKAAPPTAAQGPYEWNKNISFHAEDINELAKDPDHQGKYDFVFIPWLIGHPNGVELSEAALTRALDEVRKVSKPNVRILITPSESFSDFMELPNGKKVPRGFLSDLLKKNGYSVETDLLAGDQNYLIATPWAASLGVVTTATFTDTELAFLANHTGFGVYRGDEQAMLAELAPKISLENIDELGRRLEAHILKNLPSYLVNENQALKILAQSVRMMDPEALRSKADGIVERVMNQEAFAFMSDADKRRISRKLREAFIGVLQGVSAEAVTAKLAAEDESTQEAIKNYADNTKTPADQKTMQNALEKLHQEISKWTETLKRADEKTVIVAHAGSLPTNETEVTEMFGRAFQAVPLDYLHRPLLELVIYYANGDVKRVQGIQDYLAKLKVENKPELVSRINLKKKPSADLVRAFQSHKKKVRDHENLIFLVPDVRMLGLLRDSLVMRLKDEAIPHELSFVKGYLSEAAVGLANALRRDEKDVKRIGYLNFLRDQMGITVASDPESGLVLISINLAKFAQSLGALQKAERKYAVAA